MAALSPSTLQLIAAALFVVAVAHTFATRFFQRLAHVQPAHAGLWHLLGEVETAFGLWALVLMVTIFMLDGKSHAVDYLESRNFTEPMFVFVIMVIAGSRPILQFTLACVRYVAHAIPLPASISIYFVALTLVPLFGSFITEPAAMTLAALILRDAYYARRISNRLKYATVGALFVNVSIGGTLTPYAAPPVLMVASTWGWDVAHMLSSFGWRAALAVLVNALIVTMLFRRELLNKGPNGAGAARSPQAVPAWIIGVHLAFLAAVVLFAHTAPMFMALFLFFLGFTEAYRRYQSRLILREGLMVAFFLAGLITLGGYQRWWLQEMLAGMDASLLYWGATALTAITDNAALTYLGSLVDSVTDASKYALVAGAVTGGGLTIIANAPNPAGLSILKDSFQDQAISPLGLFLAALPPTAVAAFAFTL